MASEKTLSERDSSLPTSRHSQTSPNLVNSAGADDAASLSQKDIDGPKPEDSEFPDGGTRAWLVAAGAGGVLFCTLGYTNVFGIFQAYYMFNQMPEQSADNIAWIGSTQAFLIFGTGAIGGPLFDRFGAWVSNLHFERPRGCGWSAF